ncbi:MAG: ABC transporter substrate-binding protein [Anaerolineae bacterium]|nr:ABC transporter substrate-binding protein [Anaerolineae bacterium]
MVRRTTAIRAPALGYLLIWLWTSLALAGCTLPHSTPPIIKIGMIAPFEGLYRPDGYSVLYAVKLALSERNATGGVAGYGVMLVALNDDGDPSKASMQARKLTIDPDVVGVIGPFSRETAAAAAPALAAAGLAWISPADVPDDVVQQYPNAFRLFASDRALAETLIGWATKTPGGNGLVRVWNAGAFANPLRAAAIRAGALDMETGPSRAALALGTDPEQTADILRVLDRTIYQGPIIGGPEAAGVVTIQRAGTAAMGLVWGTSLQAKVWPDAFALAYRDLAHTSPRPEAALAYDATQVLLDAISWDITHNARPTRAGVVAAVSATHWQGMNGLIAFDANGSWINAPVHLYQIVGDQRFGLAP